MLTQGLLLKTLIGVGLAESLPALLQIMISLGIVVGVCYLSFTLRNTPQCRVALIMITTAGFILILAMFRGHQSALVLKTHLLFVERYLTTPTFYFITAIFVLIAPHLSRVRTGALVPLYLILLGLLCWGATPLSGRYPLDEAFAHDSKAKELRYYEARHTENDTFAETLAIPGWIPYDRMLLKIGGGRVCKTPDDFSCIFGEDLVSTGDGAYEVRWFGSFQKVEDDWVQHEALGRIALLGFNNGFYWYQTPNGQKFLTGPAIYPRSLEYPPKNMVKLKNL